MIRIGKSKHLLRSIISHQIRRFCWASLMIGVVCSSHVLSEVIKIQESIQNLKSCKYAFIVKVDEHKTGKVVEKLRVHDEKFANLLIKHLEKANSWSRGNRIELVYYFDYFTKSGKTIPSNGSYDVIRDGFIRVISDQGFELIDYKKLLKIPSTKKVEQDGADQPATAPELKSEGKDKPQPESKVRPR